MCRREFAEKPGIECRELHDLVFIHAENNAAHDRRSSVVEMNDGPFRTFERFEGAANQGLPGLRENLNRHIVWHQSVINEAAHKIKLYLRRRRKTDFNFLETNLYQRLEHFDLARNVHRLNQGLIAIAQVNAAPHWRLRQHRVRPGTVTEMQGGKGPVFPRRGFQHDHLVRKVVSQSQQPKEKRPAAGANGPLNRVYACALPSPPVGR